MCRTLISLPPYSKIASSSERHKSDGSSCGTEYGYIITDKGWCPRRSNGLYVYYVRSWYLYYYEFHNVSVTLRVGDADVSVTVGHGSLGVVRVVGARLV